MSPSPLAEPGILLRMVSPAVEDDRPAGRRARPPVTVRTVPGGALLRFGWLAFAIAWFVLDAAATLGRTGALGAERPLPGWWLAIGVGAGLALLGPARSPRRAAVVDLFAILLLLAVAFAGLARHDELRVCLQAAVAAWLLVAVATAAASVAVPAAVVVGAVGGAAAAAARPVAALAFGPSAVQAMSVAFLLLALVAVRWRSSPGAARLRPVALLAVSVLFGLLWSAAPPALWADVAAAERLWFAVGVGAALALAAGPMSWPAVALATFVAAGAIALSVAVGADDGTATTVLARSARAQASYDRATQTVVLAVDGEVVARAGPDHRGAELAATLVHLFARAGDRTLVLGAGTGRLPRLLLRSGRHEVEVVDGRGDGALLGAALGGDGPVPRLADASADEPRVRVRVRSWAAALAALAAGSRQAIVVAEAPHAAAPQQASVEFQRELRRVAGDGLVLQSFAFDVVPVGRLRALFGAAAVAHGWNAVLAVGEDAWLVSATAPPHWPPDDAMDDWCEEARWIAHAAHLGGVADVRRAVHGIVGPAAATAAASESAPASGAQGRREVLAVLHELLRTEPIEAVADPRSLLLRRLGGRIGVQLACDEIHGLGDGDEDVLRAQAIAVRFLSVGAPAACLQAALGLPTAEGPPLVDPALAMRRAHALDPTFAAALPPVLRSLPRPLAARGDLEDLATLPPRARLAALCVGPAPLAVALRARFASACARALLEVLAVRPLTPAETEALRELADPFVLDRAGRELQARGAVSELLALWRRDLPMPSALAALLADASPAAGLTLVRALGGRTDPDSLQALAGCLTSPALELRRAAATALRASVGDRIAYDPEWPRSALIEAADRLRSLHNRAP